MPRQPAQAVADRFWSKVEVSQDPSACWPWKASLMSSGYGQFGIKNAHGRHRMQPAHRVAYELTVGIIPEGLVIDHLCRNRRCVRPAHLEAVTMAENLRRGEGASGVNARKTACHQGHPFDHDNTYRRPDGGRECRTCAAARARIYRLAG